jgi:hypothetical protein
MKNKFYSFLVLLSFAVIIFIICSFPFCDGKKYNNENIHYSYVPDPDTIIIIDTFFKSGPVDTDQIVNLWLKQQVLYSDTIRDEKGIDIAIIKDKIYQNKIIDRDFFLSICHPQPPKSSQNSAHFSEPAL